ncbi:hypothetical protein BLOT_000611 [Blomia tropicalis]|nr:hypothetical protein BLOT_000611 [Blomia tropicalis]
MEIYRTRYEVDNLKSLYARYGSKPTPSKVFLLGCENGDVSSKFQPSLVKVNWKYSDSAQIKTISFQKNYIFNANAKKFLDIGLPEELPNDVTLRAYTRNGKRQAILKTKSDSKSTKPEQFIVVYDQDKVIKTIDVKSLNDQMTILENASYSSFVLNDDGTILLCTVEVNEKSTKGKEDNPSLADYDINSHEYRQSWGEQMNTIFHSSIAIINLELNKLVLIEKVGSSLVEPFFFKSSDNTHYSVGCIGLQELPYKLGLIYCPTRGSFLLGCKVSTEFSEVSPVEPEVYYGQEANLNFSNPRVYHNNQLNGFDCKVLFLERNAGGPHNKSVRLQQFCFETRKVQTIIDNKENRKLNASKTEYSDIGPLFVNNLPKNCFSNDGKYAFLSSYTPLETKVFAINLSECFMKPLPFHHESCDVLDVENNWITAVGSSINYLPNAYLCNLNEVSDDFTNLQWMPIEDEDSKKLTKIHFETFSFPSRDFPDKLVNCIFTSPVDMVKTPGPTMIMPHGGPHSITPACYYRSIAQYTELGLKTVLVNYVGSLGVDDEYVNALLGNVGTSDVHDVYDSIQYVIKNKHADKDRIILSGGSHGGFLVTSISGQHPELGFLACISRNPVIDLTSMCVTSDIPDWTICEALGNKGLIPFNRMYATSPQEVATMHNVSPIAHIQNVKVPTLLLLGKEDLRVPHSQGLIYHKLLKAKGIETRCFIYDDCHSLQKINVDFDCFINMAKFIEKFIYYKL